LTSCFTNNLIEKKGINNVFCVRVDSEHETRPSDEELIKTRVVYHDTMKQIVRIDNRKRFSDVSIKKFKDSLTYNVLSDGFNSVNFDCIVVSDYCKGLIDEELICKIIDFKHGKIFVDTKRHDLGVWDADNVIMKINLKEYVESINKEKIKTMIMTDGKAGCALLEYNKWKEHFSVPYIKNAEPTGAGDAYLAGLVTKYLRTQDISDAINFANKVASLSVQKFGTTEVKKQEIA
jgi:bifunctional ADP-heptose synthase (sugar kinase/adenylyltransferase)